MFFYLFAFVLGVGRGGGVMVLLITKVFFPSGTPVVSLDVL